MIDLQKKYKTRGDDDHPSVPVRLLGIDERLKYPVVGVYDRNGEALLQSWSELGASGSASTEFLDLIECLPYEDFEIDEKVWVRDSEVYDWKPRHFAGVSENGKPLCFVDGATSWVTKNTLEWNYCIKAEELK